jgi:hypothetical protein
MSVGVGALEKSEPAAQTRATNANHRRKVEKTRELTDRRSDTNTSTKQPSGSPQLTDQAAPRRTRSPGTRQARRGGHVSFDVRLSPLDRRVHPS